MSVYTEVATEFTNLADLEQAVRDAGLPCKVYLNGDGVYRKWNPTKEHDNAGGLVRGKDASLVVHGGLDRTPAYYCGDTAFVLDSTTGRYVAKIDIAHGDAPRNWERVQALYAAIGVERIARSKGLRYERVEDAGGHIRIRVQAPTRPALRQTVRQSVR